ASQESHIAGARICDSPVFTWLRALVRSLRGRCAMIRSVRFATFAILFAATDLSAADGWTQAAPATSPPPRMFAAMAYDEAGGEVVLFGGQIPGGTSGNLNDTWVWDGSTWTQRFPAASPPPMEGHAIAYDAEHAQIVLFAPGTDLLSVQTWTWDGTTWTAMSMASRVPGRSDPAMAYDAERHELVLFGGTNANAFNDTWVWDGANWTQRFPATIPSARYGHSMAYDPHAKQIVMFGGSSITPETWVW